MHAHSSSPLCPLAPYLQNRNEGVERRQRWKCERAERGREEKKLRRSEKAREEAQEVDQAKNVLVINMLVFVSIFGNLLHPSLHPSLHPRPALGPPLQKSNEKHALYTA
jgi:hypothetical protein